MVAISHGHTAVMIAKMVFITAGDLGSEGGTTEKRTWYFVRDALGGQEGDLTGSRGDKKVVNTFCIIISAKSSWQSAFVMGRRQGW